MVACTCRISGVVSIYFYYLLIVSGMYVAIMVYTELLACMFQTCHRICSVILTLHFLFLCLGIMVLSFCDLISDTQKCLPGIDIATY